MYDAHCTVKDFDDEVWKALADEETRQEDHIELIASENYASPKVLELQGSVFLFLLGLIEFPL